MIEGDRRKQPRVLVHKAIYLESTNGFDPSPPHVVEMETLSVHGLSVQSSSPLPEGIDEFTARIPLGGRKALVEARVEKIWELPREAGEGKHYGFLFTDLSSIHFNAIASSITEAVRSDQLVPNRRQQLRRKVLWSASGDDRRSHGRRWSLPTYSLFINGRDVDTGNYEYFPYADKAIADPKGTSEILLRLKNGELPEETADYIYARCCVGADSHNEEALASSKIAFDVFSAFPLSKRVKIFSDIHKLLLHHKERLLKLFIAEGHPRRLGEWEFSGMLQAFTAETVSFYKTEVSKNRLASAGERNYLLRKPDGVVCVCPPRNAASSNSLTGALSLLGGNTIVVKPPLTLPISTIFLWRNVVDEALRRNGAPKGTLNIVVGNTAKYLNQWIASPKVNDIVYFGESDRGLELGNRIYMAGKKPILELSGKDLMLIWNPCDLEKAADSLLDGFLGSTQICMVPKMAIIHEDAYERFEKIFIEKVRQLKIGLPTDPDTLLSPVSKMATFFAFLEDVLAKGGTLVCGGQRLNYKGEPDDRGTYLEPTVLQMSDQSPVHETRCFKEEIFFPLIPLIKVTGIPKGSVHGGQTRESTIYRKMVQLANQNPYGLRISVWCKPHSVIRRFIRDINNSGLLRINCKHVDFSTYLATHGGTGKTGGPFGELNYFWMKSTHLQGVSVRS